MNELTILDRIFYICLGLFMILFGLRGVYKTFILNKTKNNENTIYARESTSSDFKSSDVSYYLYEFNNKN